MNYFFFHSHFVIEYLTFNIYFKCTITIVISFSYEYFFIVYVKIPGHVHKNTVKSSNLLAIIILRYCMNMSMKYLYIMQFCRSYFSSSFNAKIPFIHFPTPNLLSNFVINMYHQKCSFL